MRVHLLVFAIGLVFGGYVANKLRPKQEAAIATIVDTKVKVVKVIERDGKITETTESSTNTKSADLPKHKYGVGLLSNKGLFGEVRIADWDLFIIGTAGLDKVSIGLKYEF